jgi:hypothetical protein
MFSEVIAAVADSSPSGAAYIGNSGGAVSAEAARPCAIVVTGAGGARAAAKYDDDARDALYERTGSILNEALTSASAPEKCAESEWREALSSPGVMFEYYSEIPLSLARVWLGAASEDAGISVHRLCLVFSDGPSSLYYEGSDGFYRAETASLAGEKTVPATYSDLVEYEFERDARSAAPYLWLTDGSEHRAASVTNPLSADGAAGAVLSSFGIGGQQSPGYTESDGTRVYIAGPAAVSISPDGLVTYRSGAVEPNAAIDAPGADEADAGDATAGKTLPDADKALPDAVETARRAVSAAASSAGNARLYFTGAEKRGDAYIINFDYFFSGGRVFFQNREHAASVTVSGGEIAETTLLFREYTAYETVTLIPERQTLAAAGGEFKLGYSDGGAGEAAPFWYNAAQSASER